mgnify:CR=1 FL=1
MRKFLRKLIRLIILTTNLKLVQLFYFIRKYNFLFNLKTSIKKKYTRLTFKNIFDLKNSYCKKTKSFNFLNKSKTFNGSINWNYSKNGLLWTYNLNYFDFINQNNLNNEDRLKLLKYFQIYMYFF